MRVNLSGGKLQDARLQNARLWGADLSEAILDRADLPGADMIPYGIFISEISFEDGEVRLGKVDVQGEKTQLTGARLPGTLLAGADLSGTNLQSADLTDAILENAVLTGADLRGVLGLTCEQLRSAKYPCWMFSYRDDKLDCEAEFGLNRPTPKVAHLKELRDDCTP